jgi:hypothetical protein
MSNRLALIIANSEYDDPKLPRLVTPSRDAAALAEVLRNSDIGGFAVTLLVDETAQVVRDEIVHLYQQKKKGDLLLLYYSGHGVKDDYGDLYLAVKDTKTASLSSRAIDAAFVCDQLDKSSSQRKVVVLDCCHSGAFAGAKAALGSSASTQEAFAGSGYGRVILTASNAVEYAWEGDDLLGEATTSVFTHFLVEGLQTGAADLNGDGQISLDELYDYVYEQVVTSGRSKQTPQKWAQKVEGQIVIAQNPHPVVKPAELPSELQQAIESPLAWMREGAVSGLERLLRGSDKGLALAAHEALTRLADDNRQVSAAATSVLDTSPLTVPAKPALVIERIEPEPKPEPHPQGRTATLLAWVQKQKNYVKSKMSGRWKWVWVAVSALIVIGFLVVLGWTTGLGPAGSFFWTETPTAPPTATLASTDIPTTDAPMPTDTPTATPKPTDTPMCTPTRTPTTTPTDTPTLTTTPTNTPPAPTPTPTLIPPPTPTPTLMPPPPPPTNTPQKPMPPTSKS